MYAQEYQCSLIPFGVAPFQRLSSVSATSHRLLFSLRNLYPFCYVLNIPFLFTLVNDTGCQLVFFHLFAYDFYNTKVILHKKPQKSPIPLQKMLYLFS